MTKNGALVLTMAFSLLLSMSTASVFAITPRAARSNHSEASQSTGEHDAEIRTALDEANKGDVDKAIKILQDLAAKYPTDEEAQLSLGCALHMAGNDAAALEPFRKAIDLNSKTDSQDANLHILYGQSLLLSGKAEEALNEYQKSLDIDPDNAGNHILFSVALLGSQDPILSSQAYAHLELARKLKSTDTRIDSMEGLALAQMGKQQEGLNMMKASVPKLVDHKEWAEYVEKRIAELDKELKNRPPAPVPPEQRRYVIKDTAAVIIHTDKVKHLVTLALESRHDPDGGKQDGVDDGIIELPESAMPTPSAVYRPK